MRSVLSQIVINWELQDKNGPTKIFRMSFKG
jgi:hypothetical protein